VEKILVEDGLVTLRAAEADRGAMLEALARESGLGFHGYGPVTGKVDVEFDAVPLNRVLEKLVTSHSIIYRRDRDGRILPSAFAVLKSGPGHPARPAASRRLGYGAGENQLGRRQQPETESRGPESFALGPDGTIFVCDTVNSRIALIPPGKDETVKHFVVPSPPVDIALGPDETYVLTQDNRLFRYDRRGLIRGVSPVPAAIAQNRRRLQAGKTGPVLQTIEGQAYLLKQGTVPRLLRDTPSVSKQGSGTARVVLPRPDGNVEVELTLPGLLSVAVLGRDPEENILIQVEELPPSGHGVDLRVIKLSPTGQVLESLEKIPNNYHNWTTRLLAVSPTGEIGQLLPGRETVELNWWIWQSPQKEQAGP